MKIQPASAKPSRITPTGRLKLDPQSTDKKLPLSAPLITPPIPKPSLTGSLPITWVEERKASAIQLQDPANPDIQAVSAGIDKYKDGLSSLFPIINVTNQAPFTFRSLAENGINGLTGKPYINIYATTTLAAAKRANETLEEKLLKIVLNESSDRKTDEHAGEGANYANQSTSAAAAEGLAKLVFTGRPAAGMREFAEQLSPLIKTYIGFNERFVPRAFTPLETSGILKGHQEVLGLYGIDPKYVAAGEHGVLVVNPDGSKKGTPGEDAISLSGPEMQDMLTDGGVNGGKGNDTFVLYGNKGRDLSGIPVNGNRGDNRYAVSAEEGAKIVINGGKDRNRATVIISPSASVTATGMSEINFIGLPGGNGQLITDRSTQINVINGGNQTVESLFAAGNIVRI